MFHWIVSYNASRVSVSFFCICQFFTVNCIRIARMSHASALV